MYPKKVLALIFARLMWEGNLLIESCFQGISQWLFINTLILHHVTALQLLPSYLINWPHYINHIYFKETAQYALNYVNSASNRSHGFLDLLHRSVLHVWEVLLEEHHESLITAWASALSCCWRSIEEPSAGNKRVKPASSKLKKTKPEYPEDHIPEMDRQSDEGLIQIIRTKKRYARQVAAPHAFLYQGGLRTNSAYLAEVVNKKGEKLLSREDIMKAMNFSSLSNRWTLKTWDVIWTWYLWADPHENFQEARRRLCRICEHSRQGNDEGMLRSWSLQSETGNNQVFPSSVNILGGSMGGFAVHYYHCVESAFPWLSVRGRGRCIPPSKQHRSKLF